MKAPIYATVVSASPQEYHDGMVHRQYIDGAGVALQRGWRILDRGGMLKALYRWGQVRLPWTSTSPLPVPVALLHDAVVHNRRGSVCSLVLV